MAHLLFVDRGWASGCTPGKGTVPGDFRLDPQAVGTNPACDATS